MIKQLKDLTSRALSNPSLSYYKRNKWKGQILLQKLEHFHVSSVHCIKRNWITELETQNSEVAISIFWQRGNRLWYILNWQRWSRQTLTNQIGQNDHSAS